MSGHGEETVLAEASAPGKLILFGEHAVVYGATAIAGALSDLRINVRVAVPLATAPTAPTRLHITIPDVTSAGASASVSHAWTWTSLAGVIAAIAAAASAMGHGDLGTGVAAALPTAVRPDTAVLAALQAAAAECEPIHRKAFVPVLFLAVAIVADAVIHPRPSAPTPPAALPTLHVMVYKPTLPVAAGLGSSAAFSVATAAALLDAWSKLNLGGEGGGQVGLLPAAVSPGTGMEGAMVRPCASSLARINDWAFASEMLFHGSPSGLDNTVSTYGGAIAYAKNAATSAITINHVHDMPPLRILVTNTKVPKETSKLVAGVRTLHDQLPTVIGPILTSINAISQACLDAIDSERAWRLAATTSAHGEGATIDGKGPCPIPLDKVEGYVGYAVSGSEDASAEGTVMRVTEAAPRGDAIPSAQSTPDMSDAFYQCMGRLMRINHGLLNAVGVGHAALDLVATTAAAHGAVTKLTGAGGGGCALTLLPPDHHPTIPAVDVGALMAQLAGLGYDCFETRLGGDGVLLQRIATLAPPPATVA